MTTHQYPATLPPEREQAIADEQARIGHMLRQAHVAAAAWEQRALQAEADLHRTRAALDAPRLSLLDEMEHLRVTLRRVEDERFAALAERDSLRRALVICRDRVYDAARWAGTEAALGEHDQRALDVADAALAAAGVGDDN